MEVLAPAGSFQKLKYAIDFGADAVYAAGKNFGLRAKAANFEYDELKEAVAYCHERNKKIYITLNIFAHNQHIQELPEYVVFLATINVDAVIVSDPAIFSIVKEYAPNLEIHISTQANVTSWRSAKFWYDLGATRVIIARELTISEIKEMKEKVPDLELEMFVHGAMCIAYSGRCLLSAYLNDRNANQGKCTQVCRWNFAVIEKERPDQTFDLIEDDFGTYIMNSKDMNLWKRLREIKDAGIDSIKIEGRMKSLYYVANVVRTYKQAVDALMNDENPNENDFDELFKISHRIYSEGFFDGFDSNDKQHYASSAYIRNYQFLGEVTEVQETKVKLSMRAKFEIGDEIEFIFPDSNKDFNYIVNEIHDLEGNQVEFTKPNTTIQLSLNKVIDKTGIIRKKI